jgi:hypothetical protein
MQPRPVWGEVGRRPDEGVNPGRTPFGSAKPRSRSARSVQESDGKTPPRLIFLSLGGTQPWWGQSWPACPQRATKCTKRGILRIVPVNSTDPEVRTNLGRFARLESPFHSGEQAAASPYAEYGLSVQPDPLAYVLYATCLFCQSSRPITAMEFGRNLRFTFDLNDSPEFPRVRLWTLGI